MTGDATQEPLRFDLDSMLHNYVLLRPQRLAWDRRTGRALTLRRLRRVAGSTQYRRWADSPRRKDVEALVVLTN